MLYNLWCCPYISFKNNFLINNNKLAINYRSKSYVTISKLAFFFFLKSFTDYYNKSIFLNIHFVKNFPANYNFEFEKTVVRLKFSKIKTVILQFPDGLQQFSILLKSFFLTNCKKIKNYTIENRTSFGACCIEDFFGKYLGACILLHYGHSCLVAISECIISIVYIFIEIRFDYNIIIEIIKQNIELFKSKFALVSIIQYASILKHVKKKLSCNVNFVSVYQNKPLSPGEILGCTCLKVDLFSNLIFIGDGRFHLEAAIITNSLCNFFQFDPFTRYFTFVEYNTVEFIREKEKILVKSTFKRTNIAVIIGVLGRQGNNSIIKKIKELIFKRKLNLTLILMREISFDLIETIDSEMNNIWIQLACPRLSIDWGNNFQKSFLNIYELTILLCFTRWNYNEYPMDFYSNKGGFWTNYIDIQSVFLYKNLINIKTNF